MFISWSGRGLLIVPIVVVVAIILIPFVPRSFPFAWPALTGIISGLIIYLLGCSWNVYKEPLPQEDSLVAVKTQYKKIPHNRHKLYWIPIQYIGIGLIILGFAFIVLGCVK